MTFVKRIAGAAVLGTALLTGLSSAEAGYVVTLQQVGGDVVATGSGPIDLTDLIFAASGFVAAGIVPNLGIVGTGPASPTAEDSYLAPILFTL